MDDEVGGVTLLFWCNYYKVGKEMMLSCFGEGTQC